MNEAELISKILVKNKYGNWLNKFLLDLSKSKTLLIPVQVANKTDPKLVHLDGLNLSRAWFMKNICKILDSKSKLSKILMASENKHELESLKYITSGNYEGEHWLASFAVYSLSVLYKND